MRGGAVTERLHADEVPIDLDLVRSLLAHQYPRFARLDLRPASSQGTDNVMFRLGDDLAVRLPRKAEAVAGLLVERDWLPALSTALPLAVPLPVAAGEPEHIYPFPWSVCAWLVGEPIGPAGLNAADADRLAGFVGALQSQDAATGPHVRPGQRAGRVADYDSRFRTALTAFRAAVDAGRIDAETVDLGGVERVWQAALEAPEWSGSGVWVHRDLLAANLLQRGGALSGVIDFGGLSVGDPAGNLMTIFHVVAPVDRGRFVAAVGADEATVARARGAAMVQGLEAWPYYLNTHPGMVAMAQRVLATTLAQA